jgi:hypothetical protein
MLVLFAQCSEKEKDEPSSKVTFSRIDTVKIEYDGGTLLLADIRKDKLLFFDFFNREILVAGVDGSVLSRFNGTFLGQNYFGDMVYGVHFQNDTTVSVLSKSGYFIFDSKWKLVEKYLHPFDLSQGAYLNGAFKLGYDEKRKMFVSLLKTSTNFRLNQKEFYDEIKHLTIFKPDSQKYDYKIKYEPEVRTCKKITSIMNLAPTLTWTKTPLLLSTQEIPSFTSTD